MPQQTEFPRFHLQEKYLGRLLLTEGQWVGTTHWQAQDISDRPEMTPWELMNITLQMNMPDSVDGAQGEVRPNLPWAEAHFLERVSGIPHNPPPSHVDWPFARKDNSEHVNDEGEFSHTYPERFWPKHAGNLWLRATPIGEQFRVEATSIQQGLRYKLGDLSDVLALLKKDMYTRQAYLPVFFPEDTGAVEGQRIPCSLGYQFLVRQRQMHIVYGIRSCDFLRHFKDDVYMAIRLAQWMRDQLWEMEELDMGTLTMHMASLHVFQGDLQLMRVRYR